MDDEKRYIDMLIDILNKQVSMLREVLAVTRHQEEIANSNDFDSDIFDKTLSEKDICIMKLNELDNGFVSVYDRVKKGIQRNPSKYKKEVEIMQSLIRQCTDIGNEVSTLETRNREKLANIFSSKKQEYSAKQVAANVVGKYNTTMRNVNLMGESYRFNQDK